MKRDRSNACVAVLILVLVAPAGTLVYALSNTGSSEPPVYHGDVITPDTGGPRVLYAPAAPDDPDWRAALAAQIGGTCDYFDARFHTPAPALLAGYDCVMTWPHTAYAESGIFGNRLADFVDNGGHVILGAFCAYGGGYSLVGRIMDTRRYCPVTGGYVHYSLRFWDGSDPGACVHQGISSYGVLYRDILTLHAGTVAGHFVDGDIANAINAAGDVVYANGAGGAPLMPRGQDAARVGNACVCGPPAGPTGACCLTDGSCIVITESSCLYLGGGFQGIGVSCDAASCPPAGACCFSDGHCTAFTASACAEEGGQWQGAETACEPNPCPQTGACCFLDGSCQIRLEVDCVAAGGAWQGPVTWCYPNPCPQPTGACCFLDTSCATLTEADCVRQSGQYQGDGVSCEPNPCTATGACCYTDGRCLPLTEIGCTTAGGQWHGLGSSCDPNPCAQPGACCLTTGSCDLRLEASCLSSGGVWQGAGTPCDPDPCAELIGACFAADCSCQELTHADCVAGHGFWSGPGTRCDGPPAAGGSSAGLQPGSRNAGGPADPSFHGNVITAAGRGIRMLYAPSESDDAGYRAAMAAQVGGTCDYYDTRYSTPSVDLLDGYDCVMTWANYAYYDNVAFGNNLATFVDRGGHVVLGAFAAYTGGNYLRGRIMDDPSYCPVTGGTNHSTVSCWDETCASGCVHTGVTGYGSTYRDYLVLRSGVGASICGRFRDGEIANAANGMQTVIYANGAGGYPLFPLGQDAARAANGCLCGGPSAVQNTTWGSLKALYR